MEKKYRLTDETIEFNGVKLYRIEALKDFGDVKKGDKGGFLQSEENLSQLGNCWIFDNAIVYGKAEVFGDAMIYCSAKVYYYAKVFDNAKVYDNANVFGDAKVFGNTKFFGDAMIYGKAEVYDNAKVCGNVKVCDDAKVCGDTTIRGFAKVSSHSDYIVFKNWWSSGRYFTWTRSNNMWSVGCFYGTGKELIEKAYKDSELSGREYKRVVKYVESILRDENQNQTL